MIAILVFLSSVCWGLFVLEMKFRTTKEKIEEARAVDNMVWMYKQMQLPEESFARLFMTRYFFLSKKRARGMRAILHNPEVVEEYLRARRKRQMLSIIMRIVTVLFILLFFICILLAYRVVNDVVAIFGTMFSFVVVIFICSCINKPVYTQTDEVYEQQINVYRHLLASCFGYEYASVLDIQCDAHDRKKRSSKLSSYSNIFIGRTGIYLSDAIDKISADLNINFRQ